MPCRAGPSPGPTCLVGHLLAHPCLPPRTRAAQVPVCFVTQQSSWCWGDAALLGGAMKLFIGEVGAGNEAKPQPWTRRRKAMTPTQGTGPLWLVAWVWAGGRTQMRGSRASSVSLPTAPHAQTGTHAHTCMHTRSHMYTRTCARTHTPYPNLGEPPAVQTLQLSTMSSPPSPSRSPRRRHLAKLKNEHLQGPLFLSSCAPTRAPRSSASPGTNATNQVVCSAAPRPPGSRAHRWTAHCLGSGTVPAAPTWT